MKVRFAYIYTQFPSGKSFPTKKKVVSISSKLAALVGWMWDSL